jgi:hypothetical protein
MSRRVQKWWGVYNTETKKYTHNRDHGCYIFGPNVPYRKSDLLSITIHDPKYKPQILDTIKDLVKNQDREISFDIQIDKSKCSRETQSKPEHKSDIERVMQLRKTRRAQVTDTLLSLKKMGVKVETIIHGYHDGDYLMDKYMEYPPEEQFKDEWYQPKYEYEQNIHIFSIDTEFMKQVEKKIDIFGYL